MSKALESIVGAALVFFLLQGSALSLINALPPIVWSLVAAAAIWIYRVWPSTPTLSPHEQSVQRRLEALRTATYPSYPNGWFKLCTSAEVPRGTVKEVKALDRVFAVYREDNTEGKIRVLDAYCPHLGANMALGKVKGEALECPFHLWQFNGEGECTKIPYTEKIPAVKAFVYPSKEWHGMVIVWFHADREEPAYQIENFKEVDSGEYTYRGTYTRDAPIRFHLQEFAENAVDYAHFAVLHSDLCIPRTQIAVPGMKIVHTCAWHLDGEKKHVSAFVNSAYVTFFGRRIPKSDATTTVTFHGPAGLVDLRFVFPDMGQILLIETHTPLEPLAQKTTFTWWAEKKLPRWFAWYVTGVWISQVVNDINIWENKKYLEKPALSGGDGPVPVLRRWYRQFYSESSRKRGDPLEW